MQTFLPEADFAETAKHLDRKRLIKQSVENLQVLKSLAGTSHGGSVTTSFITHIKVGCLRKIQNLITFIMNTQTTVNLDIHVAKHVAITGQPMWSQSDSN